MRAFPKRSGCSSLQRCLRGPTAGDRRGNVGCRDTRRSMASEGRRLVAASLAGGVRESPYLCRTPASSEGSGVVGVELRSAGGACARLMVGVLCARAPSLTSVRDPRVGSGAGDMMFDGVIPQGEALRPLGLFRPSTRAWRQETAGSRPRRICVTRAWRAPSSCRLECLLAELAQRVVGALQQLAPTAMHARPPADPLLRGQVVLAVRAALTAAGDLRGLYIAPTAAPAVPGGRCAQARDAGQTDRR